MAYTPNKVKSASEHRFKNQFKDNTFGGWAPATQAAEPARRSSPSALSPALPAPARQALGKKGERGGVGAGRTQPSSGGCVAPRVPRRRRGTRVL